MWSTQFTLSATPWSSRFLALPSALKPKQGKPDIEGFTVQGAPKELGSFVLSEACLPRCRSGDRDHGWRDRGRIRWRDSGFDTGGSPGLSRQWDDVDAQSEGDLPLRGGHRGVVAIPAMPNTWSFVSFEDGGIPTGCRPRLGRSDSTFRVPRSAHFVFAVDRFQGSLSAGSCQPQADRWPTLSDGRNPASSRRRRGLYRSGGCTSGDWWLPPRFGLPHVSVARCSPTAAGSKPRKRNVNGSPRSTSGSRPNARSGRTPKRTESSWTANCTMRLGGTLR